MYKVPLIFLATGFLVACTGMPEPATPDEQTGPSCDAHASLVGNWNVPGKLHAVTITKDGCPNFEAFIFTGYLYLVTGTYKSTDEVAAVITRIDPFGCVAQAMATITVLDSNHILADYPYPGWGHACGLAPSSGTERWERE